MKTRPLLRATCTAVFFVATASQALAADGFKLRFPLSGTLGGEIVAPMPTEGWFGSVVVTDINVTGVAGGDGNDIKITNPAPFPTLTEAQATAATDAAIAKNSALAGIRTPVINTLKGAGPASAVGTANLKMNKNHQTLSNVILGRILSKDVNGGKLVAVVNIPYVLALDTEFKVSGTTPTLSTLSPAYTNANATLANNVNAAANQIAQGVFDKGYQEKLAATSTDASISKSGIGDIEASLLWEKSMDAIKVVVGATLGMPTGNYKYTAGSLAPNIGYGNYYTLRTGAGVAYAASENVTLGARGSLGFNSQNTDNYVRSGDFYAIDLAAAFKTPVGVIGPHATVLRQYTDDTGGAFGGNQVSVTGAGFFYTAPLPALSGGVNVSYMKTMDTKNSLVGDFIQIRFSRLF